MTTPCHFPDPVGVGTCGRRGKTNEHVTLFLNGLVYHAYLCPSHRKVLTEMAPEYGLAPVGGRTKDAKRRTAYVGKSGQAFTTTQARAWLIKNGDENVRPGPGRLTNEQLARYADTH
jgi:hypothetical protein